MDDYRDEDLEEILAEFGFRVRDGEGVGECVCLQVLTANVKMTSSQRSLASRSDIERESLRR